MKGREEHEQAIENRIKRRLENVPVIIKKYMMSISGSTAATRNVYLGYIIDFFNFLSNECEITGEDYNDFKLIKKMDIDSYIEYTKINPKTGNKNGASIRNSKISAVISFFNFLVDNEIIDKNPCTNIKKIKDNKEHDVVYLTKDEIEDIKVKIKTFGRGINYEDPWRYRDYAIFILGCSTGLRNSAIREINLEDLDLDNGMVIVTEKDSVIKTVLLGNNTCNAIRQWLVVRQKFLEDKGKDSQALFISNQMKRISDVTLQAIIYKYTQDMGKKITPHKMRSTCAMNLYEATGDLYLVANQLGHKNIRNTQIYAKATKEKLKQAVDIMDNIV